MNFILFYILGCLHHQKNTAFAHASRVMARQQQRSQRTMCAPSDKFKRSGKYTVCNTTTQIHVGSGQNRQIHSSSSDAQAQRVPVLVASLHTLALNEKRLREAWEENAQERNMHTIIIIATALSVNKAQARVCESEILRRKIRGNSVLNPWTVVCSVGVPRCRCVVARLTILACMRSLTHRREHCVHRAPWKTKTNVQIRRKKAQETKWANVYCVCGHIFCGHIRAQSNHCTLFRECVPFFFFFRFCFYFPTYEIIWFIRIGHKNKSTCQ